MQPNFLSKQKRTDMDHKKLFDEFPPITTQQWEELIHKDLKGADYEKKLVWSTLEGLKIRPYYRQDDLEKLSHMGTLPGEFPFVRGGNITSNQWDIRQDFDEESPEKANVLALNALKKGADAVGLNTHNIHSKEQLQKLIAGISFEEKAVHFLHSSNYNSLFNDFVSLLPHGTDHNKVRGSLNFDPLAWFLLYGKFYHSADENYNEAMQLIIAARQVLPAFHVININAQYYHNSGAHIVQEMAFALAHAHEYLSALAEKGLSIDVIAPRMQFTFAVGSSYFMEISKLRSVKMLWAKIVEQYHPAHKQTMKMNIHAVTSSWNKSIYDPYVNMLRTTTEAMAASIAGVDSMTVAPFDCTFKKADDFSYRVARNQQIVLREESYFNKVADPSAGSYYIEKITDSLAEAAWNLFVTIEKMGGFVKAVKAGFIQQEIEKTCQKRDMDIAMRRQTFVGVNQYPNLQEKMLDKIQPTARPEDLGKIRPYRGVQAFEALRLSVENHERKGFEVPKVYLLSFGNLAMRKARATFATNFFGCAGYKIQEGAAVSDLNNAVRQALEAKPHIIVLCSSDEEYAQMIESIENIKQQAAKTMVVVAGNPVEILDQLNEAGVDEYIHLRTNTLEALQKFNHKLGIA
jgi:methylmalonyl-CoA mutase